jgi:dUTPase
MNVNKFGTKPERILTHNKQPIVFWPKDVKYSPTEYFSTWNVFAQEKLVIPPEETKAVSLRIGVHMTAGVVLISLKQKIKLMRCSILNETVLESVNDILILLQNHSKETVTINEGAPLCIITIK